jgi:hypothetical protein
MASPSFADPRIYPVMTDDPFVAALSVSARSADDPPGLVDRYVAALEHAQDEAIDASLRNAPSPASYRTLLRALDRAVQSADAVAVGLFAFPVLLVTGGRAGVRFPAILPAADRITRILRAAGALGPVENFVLSSTLCGVEAIRAIRPSRLHRLSKGSESLQDGLNFEPKDIVPEGAEEEVHLRFLAAAAVTPAKAPSLIETAAAVGLWGMAVTRELSEQMQADGASILPIPRPPVSLVLAPSAGLAVREELALQAFVSRELRQFRTAAGEPDVQLAPLRSGAIGVKLSSPFIEKRVRVYKRRLLPQEEIDEVLAGMLALLEECRVENARLQCEIVEDERFAELAGSAH